MDKVKNSEEAKAANSMGRLGEVEELAKVMAFVVSDENTYMTGANIVCDGGV